MSGFRSLVVADDEGFCVCGSGSITAPTGCVSIFVVVLAVVLPLAVLAAGAGTVWVRRRLQAADAVWRIELRELAWDAPVVILGRGTFGMVVRAQVCRRCPSILVRIL